ncbi:MAG: hypothetical protein ACFFDQ_14085, partial [Candidatus Thorarchaeota archaeon]
IRGTMTRGHPPLYLKRTRAWRRVSEALLRFSPFTLYSNSKSCRVLKVGGSNLQIISLHFYK